MKALLELLVVLLIGRVIGQCHNNCNRHGYCNKWSVCECFDGWEGADCAFKVCPKGQAIASIPTEFDTAHELLTCSGQGTCDRSTGICKCKPGFSGRACSIQSGCVNDCNDRGRCLSIREMAEENNGYTLNYTTAYSLWDADSFKTCLCDRGFQGPDCSQQVCESGVDPRLSSQTREKVTLVCDCTSGCNGKFKLQYQGVVLRKWLSPFANTSELENLLMTSPGIFSDNTAYTHQPILVYNSVSNSSLCQMGSVVENTIMFVRNAGDVSKLSFYAKLIYGGDLYFRTQQHLVCDCAAHNTCNGTYRLSFDGEMTSALNSASNGSDVLTALRSLVSIRKAGYTVNITEYHSTFIADYYISPLMTSLCTPGKVNNLTIVLEGNSGNAPKLDVWSSVVGDHNPDIYDTANMTDILSISSYDGRDDHVKLCNGLGKCDFNTGQCKCAPNWGPDPEYGPCGKLSYSTSRDAGLARCPGQFAVNFLSSDNPTSYDITSNYDPRVFLSVNPDYNEEYTGNYSEVSAIYIVQYYPTELLGPRLGRDTMTKIIDLTSNVSAGMMVLDGKEEMLYFIDHKPWSKFIGRRNLSNPEPLNYTRFIELDNLNIFTLILDISFNHRKMYYSVPFDTTNNDEGQIYWVYLDEADANPTVYKLTDSIGQTYITQPYGLALNYANRRLYWMDSNFSYPANASAVLRSVSAHTADYGDFAEIPVFYDTDLRSVISFTNLSEVHNMTDILIDITGNNTVYMLDTSSPSYGVYTMNLDGPIAYDTTAASTSDMYNQYTEYVSPRRVFSNWQQRTGQPRYLMLDEKQDLVFWTDSYSNNVGYTRTRHIDYDFYSLGYSLHGNRSIAEKAEYEPVGTLLDRGLSRITFTSYVDCYGRGVCQPDQNFHCQCYNNYFGDCQLRSCPKSLYWVGEPRADNLAHDRLVECGGIGKCDYTQGICSCPEGFEGIACERRSCPGTSEANQTTCFNQGRCLSLRQAAAYHTSATTGEPQPVVYGSSVHNIQTWDADKIYTCLPDQYGYRREVDNLVSSSLQVNSSAPEESIVLAGLETIHEHTVPVRTAPYFETIPCPRGFNRRLLDAVQPRVNTTAGRSSSAIGNQSAYYTPYLTPVLEVQQIVCEATYGSFQLSFRGATSEVIAAHDGILRFQEIVENMAGVGRVAVSATHETVCTTRDGGSFINVTFLSLLEQEVPLFQIVQGAVSGRPGILEVVRVQALALDQTEECAGHGVCQPTTGLCQCWDGYGTSDGLGGAGTHGDCGRYLYT